MFQIIKLLFLTFCFLLSNLLTAQTWNGSVSNDWTNSLNWTPNTVPTSSSNVTINNVATQPVINAGVIINQLTINTGATLTINGGGSLQVSGTTNNNGTITANAGAGLITFNGTVSNNGTITTDATASGVTINAVFTNAVGGTFTNNAPLTLNSSIINNASLSINGTFTPTTATLTNTSTLSIANAVNINANLVLNNNTGSTINLSNGLTINNGANFNNNGTINITNLLNGNVNFSNNGTINANGGVSLANAITFTNTGTFNISTGQTLSIGDATNIANNGNFTNSGNTTILGTGTNTLSGSGDLNLGTVTITKTAGSIVVSNTNTTFTNTLTIPSVLTLTITSGGQLSVTSGNVTNNGTINNNGRLNINANLVNNATFTSGTNSILGFTGAGTSQITGTNASGVVIFNLISAKTPNAPANTVLINSDRTINGSVTILPNGRIDLSANLVILQDFTNNGTFAFDNTTRIVSFQGNVTQHILGTTNTTFPHLDLSSKPTGTILNVGNLTNNTSATVSALLTIPTNITLNIANTGTLTCNLGLINNGILATTNTSGTATITIAGADFTNNNIINLNTAGANTSTINVNGGFTFTNAGTINHNQGTSNFNLTGDYIHNGTFNNVVATNRAWTFTFNNIVKPNVVIDGTGNMLFCHLRVSTNGTGLSSKKLTIMKNITFLGNLTVDLNTELALNNAISFNYANTDARTFTDNGTFTPNLSTFIFAGAATVTIAGTPQVQVPLATPTAFTTNFYNLTMNTVTPTGTNQPVGISLSGANRIITINNRLDLIMGRISSTSSINNNITNTQTRVIMASGCTFTGGNNNYSYIDGLLQRNATVAETTGTGLIFPIGKNNRIGRMRINNASTNANIWGEYFGTNFFNSELVSGTPELQSVSDREYWKIQQIGTNATVDVSLYWNDGLDGTPISTNNLISGLNGPLSNTTDITKLCVARFDVNFTPPPTENGWLPMTDVDGGGNPIPSPTTGARNTRGELSSNGTVDIIPRNSNYDFYTIGSFEDNPDWQIISWVGSATGTMQERTSWMNKNNWSPDRVPNIRSNVIILGDRPSYPDLDPSNTFNDPNIPVTVYNAGSGNPVPAPSNALPPAIRSLTLARFIAPTNLAIADTLPTLNIRNGAGLVVRSVRNSGAASPSNILDTPTNQGTGTGINVGETQNSGTITIDAGGFFLCDNTFSNNNQGQVINNGMMRIATRTQTSGNVGLINGSTNALTPKASITNNGTIQVGTYNIIDITNPSVGTGAGNNRNITNQFNSNIVNGASGVINASTITNGTQASDNNTCFITNNGTITNIANITNAQGALITNNSNWTTGVAPSTAGNITNSNTAQIVNSGAWNTFQDVSNNNTAQITNNTGAVWNITRDFTNASSNATAINVTGGTLNIGRNVSHTAGGFVSNGNINVTGTTAMSGTTFNNQSAGNYNATGTITNSGSINVTNTGLIRFQADLIHNSTVAMGGVGGVLRPYGNLTQNMNSNLESSGTAWTTTQSLDLSAKPAGTTLNWNASATFVNNVVIPATITLNTANDLRFPTIAGSLTVNGTFNLGTHSTAGRSFFLQGDFINNNVVTANTGSVVTFSGNTNTITSGTTTTNNLVNLVINKTGGATGQLNNTLNLSGNLTNTAGLQFNTNSVTNLQGNYINNGAMTAQNNSSLNFLGSTTTSVSGSVSPTLFNFSVNKTSGNLNLSVGVSYNGLMTLTNGLINSSATNLLTANVSASATSGNANSYVAGPMRKMLDATNANTNFVFPIGKGTKWARLGLLNFTNITAGDYFTAEYFPVGWGNYAFANTPTPKLLRVSTKEYWMLERNVGSGTGTTQAQVQLFWEDNIYSGINNILNDDLRVARWNGTGWENRGGNPSTTQGTVLAGSIYTDVTQSAFSPWAFGAIANIGNPLPSTLLSFEAKPVTNNKVNVEWKTSQEWNTKTFEVERSENGTIFSKVASLDAAGTSNILKNYQIFDNQPFNPITYYRLKTIDIDNSFTYSQIVAVNLGNMEVTKFNNIYPNPFLESVNVEFNIPKNTTYKVVITDLLGREVYQEVRNAENITNQKLLLYLPQLKQGTYLLKIIDGNKSITERVVKLN
jgi:hypothetical protein